MNVKYYELVFDNSDVKTCMLGVCKPTLEEATEFASDDLLEHGCKEVTDIKELSRHDARSTFGLNDISRMYVFGTDELHTFDELVDKLTIGTYAPSAINSRYNPNLFNCSEQNTRPQEFRVAVVPEDELKQIVLDTVMEKHKEQFNRAIFSSYPLQFELICTVQPHFCKLEDTAFWTFDHSVRPIFHAEKLIVNCSITVNEKTHILETEISDEENELIIRAMEKAANRSNDVQKCFSEWAVRCCGYANVSSTTLPATEPNEVKYDGLFSAFLYGLSKDQMIALYDAMVRMPLFQQTYKGAPELNTFGFVNHDNFKEFEDAVIQNDIVPYLYLDFLGMKNGNTFITTKNDQHITIYMTSRNSAKMFQIQLTDAERKAIVDRISEKFINSPRYYIHPGIAGWGDGIEIRDTLCIGHIKIATDNSVHCRFDNYSVTAIDFRTFKVITPITGMFWTKKDAQKWIDKNVPNKHPYKAGQCVFVISNNKKVLKLRADDFNGLKITENGLNYVFSKSVYVSPQGIITKGTYESEDLSGRIVYNSYEEAYEVAQKQ